MDEKSKQLIIDTYMEVGTYAKVRERLGHSDTTIWRVITEAGLAKGMGGNQSTQMKVTDVELLEAVKTMNTQEIAKRFSIHETNVLRRCKKLGVKPLGSGDRLSGLRKNWGKHNENLKSGSHTGLGDCWHYRRYDEKLVIQNHPYMIYIESRKQRVRLKCKTCGGEIERALSTVRQKNILCEYCEAEKREQRELRDKRVELTRLFYAIKQKRTPQICTCCGETFYSEYKKIYCSEKCKSKTKNKVYGKHYIARAKKYGVPFEYGITLKKVIQKDNNVCQLCGKPCDISDVKETHVGELYPSVDHIIPLSRGGGHTWDNVQLAHMICNSYKRDLLTV